MTAAETTLADFNAMDHAQASDVVAVWAAIPAWVESVAAARPYESTDELVAHAADLAHRWTRADLDAALAHHPRIGEKPTGTGAEAKASRGEQASMLDADSEVTAAIAAGNAAYEQRFDRVFLIRAAGRSPQEMRDELGRRLANDDDTEVAEALGQLAEIALLRLRGSLADAPSERITE